MPKGVPANGARKAVRTNAEVASAFAGYVLALKDVGIDGAGWNLVSAIDGGWLILGDVPEGFPSRFDTKGEAYDTLTLWTTACVVIREYYAERAAKAKPTGQKITPEKANNN